MIDSNALKSLLYLDEEDGCFYHRKNRATVKMGSIAGSLRPDGYIQIKVKNKMYLAHRLVWLYLHGKWPDQEIDHKNGIGDDNRPSNLREASREDNLRNRRKPKHNTSGTKGVSFNKAAQKWQAYVRVDKKMVHLGLFDTIEEAAAKRSAASRKHYGEFARNH